MTKKLVLSALGGGLILFGGNHTSLSSNSPGGDNNSTLQFLKKKIKHVTCQKSSHGDMVKLEIGSVCKRKSHLLDSFLGLISSDRSSLRHHALNRYIDI